jgi:hypothetical protein
MGLRERCRVFWSLTADIKTGVEWKSVMEECDGDEGTSLVTRRLFPITLGPVNKIGIALSLDEKKCKYALI